MIASDALPGLPSAIDEHAYWWNVAGDWVEPPNQRRDGWSGVLRVRHRGELVYVKRQRNHLCRTLRHPFGWPTASREWFNLKRLRQLALRGPAPLFHGSVARGDAIESVLVTEALHGFAPLNAPRELDARERTALAGEVGRVLGTMHRARLQHSCLYDKHIMVRWHRGTPEIALLDLEKMRPRLTRQAAARHDLDQLSRHQSLWSGDEWQLLLLSHAEALNRRTDA